ncbi:MAG TPA: hypothetical protein VFH48_14705 [Chloroflexota bacterium]|nr:hypothetical protein [Chloroflexota bacterium]
MSAPVSRHASAAGQLDRLTESGALDALWWSLTDCLLSAAQQMAPEAKTPAEAAWIVAGRATQIEASDVGASEASESSSRP